MNSLKAKDACTFVPYSFDYFSLPPWPQTFLCLSVHFQIRIKTDCRFLFLVNPFFCSFALVHLNSLPVLRLANCCFLVFYRLRSSCQCGVVHVYTSAVCLFAPPLKSSVWPMSSLLLGILDAPCGCLLINHNPVIYYVCYMVSPKARQCHK